MTEDSWKSRPSHFQDFIDSCVWTDMKTLITSRIETELSKLEAASELAQINRIQGAIKILRDMLQLPEFILEDLKQEESNNA